MAHLAGSLPDEPPLYRPFALLAFGAAVLVGTPLGAWGLAWLYLGGPAIPAPWLMLHAHVQVFGFFATLIPGVAQHLLPRFTGRPFTRAGLAPWLAAALGTALVLRIGGTALLAPPALLAPAALAAAAGVQAAAFAAFGIQVWRALDPPPLRLVRVHLTAATAWLALACALEAALRVPAATAGGLPSTSGLRAVHAVALLGGVVGWILGVLLRAGPMFVPHWRVPLSLARGVPVALGLGCALALAGEMGPWPGGPAMARLGDAIGLGTIVAVAIGAGALAPSPRSLPMLSRSAAEARIFRLAVVAAVAALVGMVVAAAAEVGGRPAHVLTDAARHLFTVGVLTSVVVAMSFRLIPVLERVPLPWPRLRQVALAALVGAVVGRTAAVLVAGGWTALAPLVAASGPFAWIALASVAVSLVAAMVRRAGAMHAGPRR